MTHKLKVPGLSIPWCGHRNVALVSFRGWYYVSWGLAYRDLGSDPNSFVALAMSAGCSWWGRSPLSSPCVVLLGGSDSQHIGDIHAPPPQPSSRGALIPLTTPWTGCWGPTQGMHTTCQDLDSRYGTFDTLEFSGSTDSCRWGLGGR